MTRKELEPSMVTASIPAGILSNTELTHGAKILFGCIHALVTAHDHCFISNRTLAKRMGLKHEGSVRRLLKELQDGGLIARQIDEKQHRVEIELTWKPGKIAIDRTRDKAKTRAHALNGANPPAHALPPPSACAGGAKRTRSGAVPLREAPIEQYPSSAAREDAAAALAVDLLRRGEELGLKGFSEAKLDDAIQTFNSEAVSRALDQAEKHGAESWGYCLTMLRRWRAEGELPQPQHKARRNGKPQPVPPSIVYQAPPDDTPLEPGEALAAVAEMKRRLAAKEAQP